MKSWGFIYSLLQTKQKTKKPKKMNKQWIVFVCPNQNILISMTSVPKQLHLSFVQCWYFCDCLLNYKQKDCEKRVKHDDDDDKDDNKQNKTK